MLEKDENISQLTSELPFKVDEYNMTTENDSTFLDIGSGFGKPVFHAAM